MSPDTVPRPALLAALVYGLALGVLTAAAPPRTIGDAGEYLTYALALSRGFTPPLTDAAFAQARADIAPFDPALAEWPMEEVAHETQDGRRDFIHFWLYPALAAPAVAIARVAGADPRLGFAALNIMLLSVAFGVLWTRLGWPTAVLLLAGPVIWWADKVHPEAFIVSLMAMALAVWRQHPGPAIACAGIVATQVTPFAIFVPLLAAAAIVHRRDAWRQRSFRAGLAGGVLAPLLPAIYYLIHFGRPSLLAGLVWSSPSHLSPAGAVLWDLNIGLVPNWPVLALVVAAIPVVLALSEPRRLLVLDVGSAAIGGMVMLAAFASIGNFMHGATPGIIRYAIWLVPLAVPVLALAKPDPRWSRVLAVAAVVSAALSVQAYRPSVEEFSHRPTAIALWVWRHHPSWSHPTAEIFARSLAQRGGTVPLASPGCGKILLMGRGDAQGMWPRPCPPAPVPDECRAPGAACYANRSGERYMFRRLAHLPDWLKYDRSHVWPRRGEQAISTLLHQMAWSTMEQVPRGRRDGPLAGAHAIDIEAVYLGDRRALLILAGAGEGARLDLRGRQLYIRILDAETGSTVPAVPVASPDAGILSLPLSPQPGPFVVALMAGTSQDEPHPVRRTPDR
jgi:hypothetical protein